MERSATIEIGAKAYDMVLTTRATKEIAKRYGGLENLGDKLMKSENFELALEEIVWLICLLCNQGILIYNLEHQKEMRELLTEDAVELLTSPLDLADYKNAILEAMVRGTKRFVESEDVPSKNASAEQATKSALPG